MAPPCQTRQSRVPAKRSAQSARSSSVILQNRTSGMVKPWWRRRLQDYPAHGDEVTVDLAVCVGDLRRECQTFCVLVMWSMLPERSEDDDDLE
jgi:hypothetical protein